MVFGFSTEAERTLQAYLAEVDKKINQFGFKLTIEHRQEVLCGLEHALRVFSVIHMKKRGSRVVEEQDAKKATKHASPSMLVRHSLQNPERFAQMERLRERHLEAVSEKASSTRCPLILDAGCGYGRQLMYYRRHMLRGKFVGIDTNKEAIEYGKSVDRSIDFLKGDVQGALPFRESAFDIVVCIGVLHETKQQDGVQKAIQDFARVLKPEGLFFATDAFTTSRLVSGIAKVVSKLSSKIERYHHRYLMETALAKSRFTITSMERLYPTFFASGYVYAIYATTQKKT